ncbi:MAG: hypothetical protein OEZ01_08230 [Candidatus Heimdallarchaeota archaeon]|nr:hypothetical protein [Candidatus Heimdallarchaeota archaeon]
MYALNKRIAIIEWEGVPLWSLLLWVVDVPLSIFAFVVPGVFLKVLFCVLIFMFFMAGIVLLFAKNKLLLRGVLFQGLLNKMSRPLGIENDGLSR